MLLGSTGRVKLGQPEPLSYLSVETKKRLARAGFHVEAGFVMVPVLVVERALSTAALHHPIAQPLQRIGSALGLLRLCPGLCVGVVAGTTGGEQGGLR
jgi:hypothetical protein